MLFKEKFKNFIFLSAGPIGDHILLLDVAHHFYQATGVRSKIFVKHPNSFITELSSPYKDFVTIVPADKKKYSLFFHIALSIFFKDCYILFFPIPAPRFLKMFAFFIRFCTRSKIVGIELQGTRSFPLDNGYSTWLGKANVIPLREEPFTATANSFLSFLGYVPIEWTPKLLVSSTSSRDCIEPIVQGRNFIVFHITPSGFFRTLPSDKWNKVIASLREKVPDILFVFTGGGNDKYFIDQVLEGISRENVLVFPGTLSVDKMLALYTYSLLNVAVQTGNGLIINMLHNKTVMVNIKGTKMFDYSFNKQLTNLYSEKDCECNPFETQCTLLPYKSKYYMACVFNLTEDQIVNAIVSNIHA